MNAHIDNVIIKTFCLLFFIFLFSACSSTFTKPISQIILLHESVTHPVPTKPPMSQSVFAGQYGCPKNMSKLCGAYDTIQNRYVTRISDDELTEMFIKGTEILVAQIKTAPFVCGKHTQKLCDTFYTIQNQNGGKFPDAKLTEIMIKGVIKEISKNDPYSKYFPLNSPPENFGYSGIGLVTDKDANFPSPLVVGQAIRGEPADRAGIKRGDRITHVNGISVLFKSQEDAAKLIRGDIGTRVRLTIIQGCSEKPRNIYVRRSKIRDTTSGYARIIDGNFAYVHLENFLGDNVKKAAGSIERLEETNGAIRGLIIDLRDNPGGSVMQSVHFVGLFVGSGDALYEKNQDGNYVAWKIPKGSSDIIPGRPIVVLVNKDSASASELVAGALKDFGRATIVGTTTYGKGVMQTTLALKDRSTIVLTIAYTFTPNKTAIHKIGIIPDVFVKEGKNESCTGDEQFAAAIRILREKGVQ